MQWYETAAVRMSTHWLLVQHAVDHVVMLSAPGTTTTRTPACVTCVYADILRTLWCPCVRSEL